MFNIVVDLFLIEGRILKMLKSMTLVLALVCVVLVRPAWPAALTLTVATSKQVYNAGETLQIEGNLTDNGVPVPDGLVLLQINNPKGGQNVDDGPNAFWTIPGRNLECNVH
jgi:hypothetical protein